MIILHEEMPREAQHVQKTLESLFDFPITPINTNLDTLFVPLPEFDGFWCSELAPTFDDAFPDTAVLILTQRDLYGACLRKEEDWVFGYSEGKHNVVSAARLKGIDNQPRADLAISEEQYLCRVALVGVHEIGHHIVKASHYLTAKWVNARTGRDMSLGLHCTDNTCIMYESIDVKAPPADAEYLLLGDERRYDAGFDEHIARMRSDFFCTLCKESTSIPEAYYARPHIEV